MVVLYVGGQPVGSLNDSEKLLELAAQNQEVEFRDEAGKRIGKFTPDREPLCPWDPSITKEELDRRAAEEGGMSLAEFWKKMGVS